MRLRLRLRLWLCLCLCLCLQSRPWLRHMPAFRGLQQLQLRLLL